MTLNSSSLNSAAINAAFSSGPTTVIGEGTIIAIEQVVGILPVYGAGCLIQIDQNVQVQFSGTLFSISQDVQAYVQGAGTLLSISQKVQATGAGSLISLSQNVSTPASNTFLTRNNYDIDIYVNNVALYKGYICDNISIRRNEGQAAQLDFTLNPALGVQTPEEYLGLPVFANITDGTTGQIYRVFTGWVDNLSLDLIEQKVKYICSDRRATQINSLPYSILASIGDYNRYVFGFPIDQADELSKRLSTTPQSFDFDGSGNYTITPWAPKSSPDFTLSDGAIYYEKPNITYNNRTRSLNTVNITINYKHQRLHQQTAQVVWNGYDRFIEDWYLIGSPSFPLRTTITSAAQATSWTLLSPLNFVDLWPPGGYSGVLWAPDSITSTYAKRQIEILQLYYPPGDPFVGTYIWPDGKEHATVQDVLDPNGNPIYDVASTTVSNTSKTLCRGANWIAGKKFAQSVNELYTLNIKCPSEIARYGIVDEEETITINDPYDTSAWTNDKTPYNPNITPGTAVNSAIVATSGYSKGATRLTLATVGTGSMYVGNQFTINGDTSGQTYTVAQAVNNVGAGGTLYIMNPGLASTLLPASIYTINLIPTSPFSTANFFIDQKPLYQYLGSAIQTVCDKAKTSLLSAHRDVSVKFKRSLWPQIDLSHTVQTTATRIACKGKVHSISHSINVQTGEAYSNIELLLSRASGNDTASPNFNVNYPPYEDVSYIGAPFSVSLATHTGINPSTKVTPSAITWNGYIGNANDPTAAISGTRTQFQESFVVDYPALPSELTGERTITANPPGINNGVTTDAVGYPAGSNVIGLAAGGTGQLLQGDAITITGDTSLQTYIVQRDVLDVSGGGSLSISPGLGAALIMTTHAILSSPPSNSFVVNIPNDPLVIEFL